MKKRVAIFQNTLTGGGRIRVVNEIIKILNEFGIIPDVYTFRVNLNLKKRKDIEYNIVRIPEIIRGFYELKVFSLNWFMKFYKKNYDLLINSNNTLLFAPQNLPVLTYVHFLRESRILSKYQSLAFPDRGFVSEMGLIPKIYRKILIFICLHGKASKNNVITTNSEYTKSMFMDVYPENSNKDIDIICPPVYIDEWRDAGEIKRENTVVSLGRFSEDKRQLEQLKIAGCLPGLNFEIIGFVGDKKSRRYYEKCRKFICENSINNVRLQPDMSFKEIKKILRRSKYFIHNLRNEPFGIATVEAIAAGCIPIVHDSGGQKEIVPFDDLRFEDWEDCVEKVTKIRNQDNRVLINDLQKHINEYDITSFCRRMRGKLESLLCE